MQQVKLLNVKVYNTSKDGTPLTGQWGAYNRISALFDLPEMNGEWASCNVKPGHPATRWQPNSFVTIEGFGKKNGYYNFTLPKTTTTQAGAAPSQTGAQLLEKLFVKMDGIEKKIDLLTEITRGLELGDVKVDDPLVKEVKKMMDEEDNIMDVPF